MSSDYPDRVVGCSQKLVIRCRTSPETTDWSYKPDAEHPPATITRPKTWSYGRKHLKTGEDTDQRGSGTAAIHQLKVYENFMRSQPVHQLKGKVAEI